MGVWCRLNNIEPPVFHANLIATIQSMIMTIRETEAGKKVPLPNPYELHKCFQLLNLTKFLLFFPCLKVPKRHESVELQWKQICEELGWDYIPSLPKANE